MTTALRVQGFRTADGTMLTAQSFSTADGAMLQRPSNAKALRKLAKLKFRARRVRMPSIASPKPCSIKSPVLDRSPRTSGCMARFKRAMRGKGSGWQRRDNMEDLHRLVLLSDERRGWLQEERKRCSSAGSDRLLQPTLQVSEAKCIHSTAVPAASMGCCVSPIAEIPEEVLALRSPSEPDKTWQADPVTDKQWHVYGMCSRIPWPVGHPPSLKNRTCTPSSRVA
eukprot:TRINITY_DN9715_c0_g1_i4.p2 TRINITY_DN9715_c0_g1~~TRINITY_DN9715_c0_g1_i4.p2  ORF type:complete len:225 (+),score=24.31 TRINITY_DN9715_c0_g1_i4:209-883(+)